MSENTNNAIDNKGLLIAIEKMIEDNVTANAGIFINQMISAKFITPITIDDAQSVVNADGSRTLQEDTNVNLKTVTNTEGDEYLIVFLDWQEVKKWDETQTEAVILDYYGLTEIIFTDEQFSGFVINPFTTNFIMTRDKITAINAAISTAELVEDDE